MVRLTLILVMAACSAAISVTANAQAYLADRGPAAPAMAGTAEPDPLPGLPRPPEQPKTLYQPAPAPGYGCPDLECPYFDRDPILDPCWLPQPGWLFDVETDFLGVHLVNQVGNTTPPIAGVVNVPMASLNTAISPKFELGYRLPDAFGEFDVSYRFATTEGVGTTPAGSPASPDVGGKLSSHFDLDVGDVDYASVETSLAVLGPNILMKWRVGLRTADVLFTSQADEPIGSAASGFYEHRIENNYWGIGPHAGVELTGPRTAWGLGLVGKVDTGLLFGKVHQKFVEISTGGVPTETDYTTNEVAPMLNGFLGLDWQPPNRTNFDFALGATAEYWWNIGRISDPYIYNGGSAGEVGAYGLMLRMNYNY